MLAKRIHYDKFEVYQSEYTMTGGTDMAQMLVRSPQDLKDSLQSEAKRIGITLNALLIQILREWTDEHTREINIEQKSNS